MATKQAEAETTKSNLNVTVNFSFCKLFLLLG